MPGWPPLAQASLGRIAELLDDTPEYSPVARKAPVVAELKSLPAPTGRSDQAAIYEHDVFRTLVAQRETLGVAKVLRFENLLVDGAVVLNDGRAVLIEVKYRMGWLKACQAEWQVRTALRSPEVKAYRPKHGLVVFEEFSGDWARVLAGGLQHGWRHWYLDHCAPSGRGEMSIVLVRFRSGKFERPPIP